MKLRLHLWTCLGVALIAAAPASAQEFPEVALRRVRALNTNGDGSILEHEIIRVTGVTTTSGRQFAPTTECDEPPCEPGVGFYVDDGEAAIFVWSYFASAGIATLVPGTRVRVTGLVRSFQGRLMLTDYNDPACEGDDQPERCREGSIPRIAPGIEVLEQGVDLPLAVAMDLQGFLDSSEPLEGRRVAIVGVFSDDRSQALPRAGTPGAFNLHDTSLMPPASPATLYIDATTDIPGRDWPDRSQCDLIAIADQFLRSDGAPGERGRRLRARDWTDFTNFRPRADEQLPQARVLIAALRPAEGVTGPHEGRRVWIEGWLTTEFRTFGEQRTSGVGFAVQDDSGGVIVRSSTINDIWLPAVEGAPSCTGVEGCSAGERCGPYAICQEVAPFSELRTGVRVRIVAKVTTRRGRMILTDPRREDPIMIEKLGAGANGEAAERLFAPQVVTARELLRGAEAYEGVLLTVPGLHLADADQQLPRAGQAGSFRLGDEEQVALDVFVEKFACELDDGAQVCINRSSMSLPPESFSGKRDYDRFQFDLTGIGDERAEGGGAGQRGLLPRAPSDFSNFRDRRSPEAADAGPAGPPTHPRGDSGCDCGATGAGGLLWLLLPIIRRRRRAGAPR
jgi:hypothetical protein